MGMTYHCHGCGNNVRSKEGRCPKCGLREDVDHIINETTFWKSLNEYGREKIISIIEKGLDA